MQALPSSRPDKLSAIWQQLLHRQGARLPCTHLHVQALLVGGGVDSHGLQAQLPAGADHAHGNLTTAEQKVGRRGRFCIEPGMRSALFQVSGPCQEAGNSTLGACRPQQASRIKFGCPAAQAAGPGSPVGDEHLLNLPLLLLGSHGHHASAGGAARHSPSNLLLQRSAVSARCKLAAQGGGAGNRSRRSLALRAAASHWPDGGLQARRRGGCEQLR